MDQKNFQGVKKSVYFDFLCLTLAEINIKVTQKRFLVNPNLLGYDTQ